MKIQNFIRLSPKTDADIQFLALPISINGFAHNLVVYTELAQ
jgi:hypothetical protein